MSNTAITIRTDSQTKQEITRFAASVGLSVSAFATVVLKQAAREGRVVLEPTLEPTPYLEKIMREFNEDIEKNGHKNLSEAFDNVDDFFADLEKNDK